MDSSDRPFVTIRGLSDVLEEDDEVLEELDEGFRREGGGELGDDSSSRGGSGDGDAGRGVRSRSKSSWSSAGGEGGATGVALNKGESGRHA
jgi:hypothetical protein